MRKTKRNKEMNNRGMMSCGICGRDFDKTKDDLLLHMWLVINIYSRQSRSDAVKCGVESTKEYRLDEGIK
jgi:transcription elongation factor Elf1